VRLVNHWGWFRDCGQSGCRFFFLLLGKCDCGFVSESSFFGQSCFLRETNSFNFDGCRCSFFLLLG